MERNVALIILDTVRKDYFDDFAERLRNKSDSSFSQCRAAATWSTPSHASILTGYLLHQHGVHDGSQSYETIENQETFIQKLSGYHKLCITDHGLLQPTYGFDMFFDTHRTTGWESIVNQIDLGSSLAKYWTALVETIRLGNPYSAFKNVERALWESLPELMNTIPYVKRPDQGAAELTRIAKHEVTNSSEPFFLFMNYMDAHTKYRVNKHLDPNLHSVPDDWVNDSHYVWESEEYDDEYVKNYRQLYAASIDYLDRKVSDLVNHIQRSTERETTILITADHGHNLGYDSEDNLIGHMGSVSESVLHVPLEIINPPEDFPSDVSKYFSHLNLGELIIRLSKSETNIDDLVGSPIVAEHEGLVGAREKIEEFPGTSTEFEMLNRMIRVIYQNQTKWEIDSLGQISEYELEPSRPCFQRPVNHETEIPQLDADIFETEIEEYKRNMESIQVDDDVRDDLKHLGYL